MPTRMDDYIVALQEKLRDYLRSYIELLPGSAIVLYQKTNSSDAQPEQDKVGYDDYIVEIKRKIDDVMLLQIRIPIVAPMKAGKSTIINALIGSDFLPTRVDAMTALPTTIVLKLGESYLGNVPPAALILQEQTLNAVRTLRSNVTEKLKMDFTDDRQLDDLLKKNPHLTAMAKDFRDGTEPLMELQSKLEDTQQVHRILTFINDLVRISIYLSFDYPNLLLSLDAFRDNFPIINVHNCPIQNTQQRLEHRCQVLLIDTPGPDEAGSSGKLRALVMNELRRADIILAVVEYSHIDTEAGKLIADDIRKIRAIKNNQDCVYVLVSKVDQYKRKDMSKEKLHEHVAALFNVSKDRVFELSGQNALIAQKFLAIYQKSQHEKYEISDMAKDVMEVYCPSDWEDLLSTSTAADVASKAERLYVKSGLGTFLNTAIEAVLGQVVRRCIESAISTCTKISGALLTDINIRLNGLEVFKEKLRNEIDTLNQDLIYLKEMKATHVADLEHSTKTLEEELCRIFKQAFDEYKQTMEGIFNENNEKWIDREKEAQRSETKNTELIATISTIAVGASILGRVANHVGSPAMVGIGLFSGVVLAKLLTQETIRIIHGGEEEIPFDDPESAQKFIDDITKMVNKASNCICSKIGKAARHACREVSARFYAQMKEKTTAILQRANDRLNSTFQIELIVPETLQLEYQEINLSIDEIGRVETSMFWLVYSKLTNQEQKQFVSRSKLQEACVTSVKANLMRIQKDIVEGTSNEMETKFTSHFRDLHAYLERYRGYANLSLSDKLLDKEKQTHFKLQLQNLKEQWVKKVQEIKALTDSIDWNQIVERN